MARPPLLRPRSIPFARPVARGLAAGGLFACGLAAGCNGAPPPLYGDSPAVAAMLDAAPPPDLAIATYPPGPYGNKKGDTLADIAFSGYRLSPGMTDPDALMWDTTIKLSEYHANPACKCLLVTWGATWCGACQQEQPALVDDVAGDASFCVLNILQEGPQQGTLATESDVHDWSAHFHQNYWVVEGTKQSENLWNGWGMGNPPTIGLPFNFVVDPKTMKILDNVQGFDPQIHDHAMALCGQ